MFIKNCFFQLYIVVISLKNIAFTVANANSLFLFIIKKEFLFWPHEKRKCHPSLFSEKHTADVVVIIYCTIDNRFPPSLYVFLYELCCVRLPHIFTYIRMCIEIYIYTSRGYTYLDCRNKYGVVTSNILRLNDFQKFITSFMTWYKGLCYVIMNYNNANTKILGLINIFKWGSNTHIGKNEYLLLLLLFLYTTNRSRKSVDKIILRCSPWLVKLLCFLNVEKLLSLSLSGYNWLLFGSRRKRI